MGNFSERYTAFFRSVLPAPFTIAVVLTVLTYLLAIIFTGKDESGYAITLLQHWENGLWENGLLVFALQMMLMLVLGHVLALTKPVSIIISKAVVYCTDTARAAFMVTLLTVIVSLFNWGLGIIFGAIFARKVGEYAAEKGIAINYPIIGAAGYSGLMVWHGGLSGSSLTKIAESGHIKQLVGSTFPSEKLALLPESITFSETVFSGMNIAVTLVLLLLLPLGMYLVGKKATTEVPVLVNSETDKPEPSEKPVGAGKLDNSSMAALVFGGTILLLVVYKMMFTLNGNILAFFTPNNINFLLLGLGIILHGSFVGFLKGADGAIGGAAGILIQFPLYFGIMGIMKNSGLVTELSEFFVSISNATTYPLFTFLSAGIVNVFVPSGGGQWAVQGPIIVQAATELGLSLPKSIMAMAYGDQLTNMLQPFWALPLLGITGLKAKEILPYTLYLMLLGGLVFIVGLLIF